MESDEQSFEEIEMNSSFETGYFESMHDLDWNQGDKLEGKSWLWVNNGRCPR